MKYPILFLLLIFTYNEGFCQNSSEYSKLTSEGWQLCLAKDYKSSAKLYEKAFELNQNVPMSDRYNASCIYALAGNEDMAFHHLFIIANELKWTDHNHLHADERWEKLDALVIKNKKEEEAGFDKDLVVVLDEIYFDDQSTRNKIRPTEEQYGRDSKEMDALWQDILKKDSINLIKVNKILTKQGWPDKKFIGERGSTTLFLVIQHADHDTQEKYLPMIEKAVQDNNLPKRQFAMFYDRLVLSRGERQMYGTQLAMSKESKLPYVLPLADPKNVDERRAQMGLNTMQENLNRWNLNWNVEAHIKGLSTMQAKELELNKKKEGKN